MGSLKERDGKLSCFSKCKESLEKAEAGHFHLPLSPLLLVLLLNVRQGKLGLTVCVLWGTTAARGLSAAGTLLKCTGTAWPSPPLGWLMIPAAVTMPGLLHLGCAVLLCFLNVHQVIEMCLMQQLYREAV